ncbi:hypothetical protein D1007_40511 [Hordeum vulgare]|nr:hypothetical protein D1007_40511 [Hordeum vulgare]
MEFGMHFVETHMREMDLTVVYTNGPVMVDDSINTMERLLAKNDKYKVVGFDLAYTGGCPCPDDRLARRQGALGSRPTLIKVNRMPRIAHATLI